MQRQAPSRNAGLLFQCANKPEPEINGIADTETFNEIIKGYLTIAMQTEEIDFASIREVLGILENMLDNIRSLSFVKIGLCFHIQQSYPPGFR